jgi:hypothetical protein
MRLRSKDLLASILFAAIAVPYVGYLVNGEMPFIKDPRGMSATGLVLGVVAYLVMRRDDLFDRVGKAETARASCPGPATGPDCGTRSRPVHRQPPGAEKLVDHSPSPPSRPAATCRQSAAPMTTPAATWTHPPFGHERHVGTQGD